NPMCPSDTRYWNKNWMKSGTATCGAAITSEAILSRCPDATARFGQRLAHQVRRRQRIGGGAIAVEEIRIGMVEQIVDTGRQRQPRLRPATAHIKHCIARCRALARIRVDAGLVVGKTHSRFITP